MFRTAEIKTSNISTNLLKYQNKKKSRDRLLKNK